MSTHDDTPQPSPDRWARVSKVVQRNALDASLPGSDPGKLLEQTADLPSPSNVPARPDGIIANYRANKITRRAALDMLQALHDKQLEVAKHHLENVARVKKAESTMMAERFLQTINAQHIEYLTQLGLRNEDARNQAFLALGHQTSGMLRQLEQVDWPEFLVEQTIQGVIARNKAFFDKITRDLGDA